MRNKDILSPLVLLGEFDIPLGPAFSPSAPVP